MIPKRSEREHLIRSGEGRKGILLKTNIVLLVALSMIIFLVPAIPFESLLVTRILLGIIIISGLFAADFSRAAFRILAIVGALVILTSLADLLFPESQNLNVLVFFLNTLFFIIVTIALVAHVAMAREVYPSTVLCAINSYLLIGLTLSILFLILDFFAPVSFLQMDASDDGLSSFIYFGLVTLTTLGYGDITPATPLARSLASFTALFGQLYLVIIMALIIGKYLNWKNNQDQSAA
jgi:hypothetical protein